MNDARQLIEAIRGGSPSKCDWCQKTYPSHMLEPEESGEWVCHSCIARWELTNKAHWHNGQPFENPRNKKLKGEAK